MKWFYVIAVLCVAGLASLPMTYLKAEDQERPYSGLIVDWTEDGGPVRKERPVVFYGAWSSTIRSWDQVTCGDTTSSSIQSNFYEGLYAYHYLKRPPEVIPLLAAETPEVEPFEYEATVQDADGKETKEKREGRVYTIKLKKDVLYQRNPCFGREDDGRPRTRAVKAQDFVLTFKRCADYHIRPSLSWSFLAGRVRGLRTFHKRTKEFKITDFSRYDLDVEGVRALDDHTLQIKLNEPFPPFIYVLAMHVYAPTPREAVDYWLKDSQPRTAEFRARESLVGTGPYLVKEYVLKDKLVLARNPDYREDLYPSEGEPGDRKAGLLDDAGKRVPFVDVIQFKWMPQIYSAWMMFLAKRTDSSGIPSETFDVVITPGKDLTDQWARRHIYLRTASDPSIYWFAFNMEDPIVGGSKALRQALCLAYDVESHIKVLYNSRGRPAVNIVPSSFPSHDDIGPGPYYRLDLDAAKKKVEQARRELKAKGLLDSDGGIPALTLDMTRGDRAAIFSEFAKQQFGKIGLRLKVEMNDWSMLQEKVNNKQTQLYTMGWHADYPDGENFFQLFWTKNIDKGTNDTNYSNPEFDALYEKARVMNPSPERTKLYVKMGRIISEDCPVLLLHEPTAFSLYYDWVKNVKQHPIGYGFTKYRRIDVDLRQRLGGRN